MSQNNPKHQKNVPVRRTYALVRRTWGLFHFRGLSETKVCRTDNQVRRTSGLTTKNLHFSPQNDYQNISNPNHDIQTHFTIKLKLNKGILTPITWKINRVQIRATKSSEIDKIDFKSNYQLMNSRPGIWSF